MKDIFVRAQVQSSQRFQSAESARLRKQKKKNTDEYIANRRRENLRFRITSKVCSGSSLMSSSRSSSKPLSTLLLVKMLILFLERFNIFKFFIDSTTTGIISKLLRLKSNTRNDVKFIIGSGVIADKLLNDKLK